MSGAIDLVLLGQLVGGVIATLGDYYTHEKLGEACERLGLPEPPGRDEGTKPQRVETSFAALPAAALPDVAERILMSGEPPEPDAATRNALQDVLWAGQGAVTRRFEDWLPSSTNGRPGVRSPAARRPSTAGSTCPGPHRWSWPASRLVSLPGLAQTGWTAVRR
jgi:hypothetical protein